MSKLRLFLVISVIIFSVVLLSFFIFHKNNGNFISPTSDHLTLKLTRLATFTQTRFLKVKQFDNKIYILTDDAILDLNGKPLFKFKATSPYDFIIYNGNYFVSDLPKNEIITNKGIIKTDVWPSLMKIHNDKIYAATLRSNKLDVIDPVKCKFSYSVRVAPVPVDFLFIKDKLYTLSSGCGAIFGNSKRTDLNFGVFSVFSYKDYIFAVSPKKIYKLDENLKILKVIEVNYLINCAFFDKALYIVDTFGYIRKFNLDLKETDFVKFTDYAISALKINGDFYLSNVNGIYKNNELLLGSNSIVDIFDKDHILYSDGMVKIGKTFVRISGYPKRIIYNKGYTFCFNQSGYIYMFDSNAKLILKKFVQGGIEDVGLFDDKIYIITLNSIMVLDSMTLSSIVSKRISILPYKMKFYNGDIYVLSIFSRTINEYSQDLSLVKEFPLQKTSYDFYFYDSKIQIDPNLIFTDFVEKYNLLVSYDGSYLYLKRPDFYKKLKLNLKKIVITDNIYLLTSDSLIELSLR